MTAPLEAASSSGTLPSRFYLGPVLGSLIHRLPLKQLLLM